MINLQILKMIDGVRYRFHYLISTSITFVDLIYNLNLKMLFN